MFTPINPLLYPPVCLLCHQRVTDTAVFCEACQQGIPAVLPPVCQRCGVGLAGAYDVRVACQRCQRAPFAFERARAPFRYSGMMREAIHAFKYDGRHRIGHWLAAHMAQTAEVELPLTTIDQIVSVPMHGLKARFKGVNPAAFLAQAVARRVGLPCDLRALKRTRWTTTQTRLTRRQRFRNVAGAFAARRSCVSGRVVLLVDDVLTSGATAHACAAALQEAGASRVFVLTAACATPA